MLKRSKLIEFGYSEKSIKEYFDYHNKRKVKIDKKKSSKNKKKPKLNKYKEYLKSKEWADIKTSLYRSRGKVCEMCSSVNQIEVHHLHYKNLFKEEPQDLMLLCRSCHKKFHKK